MKMHGPGNIKLVLGGWLVIYEHPEQQQESRLHLLGAKYTFLLSG
jgi:hypothetical protein